MAAAAPDTLEFLFTRSLEFRQETIYSLIVDRFYDGHRDNNGGPNPAPFDPTRTQWGKYWGGDLQGVLAKLDYLKSLGVTALWLSPLLEQVEDLMLGTMAAMHGYWTKDFKRVNPRFLAAGASNSIGACSALTQLIAEMHRRGMKRILDIVCNHSSPNVNGQKGRLHDDGVLIADFDRDVRNWYHHNPEITDWEDEQQLLYYEMAGLATFNESNIEFRNYIKSAIKLWLNLGVDALRVDTVKHMPLWFWQEFVSDMQSHKPSVFMFGEWGFSKPQDANSVRFANHSGMSVLDFGFCEAVRAAIALHGPGGFHLVQNLLNQEGLYRNATEHDMPRFLSLNGDRDWLRLAVGLLLTSRGIPCLYYGTEQYLHNYVFLRAYRDYRCLVFLNQGPDITIDVQNVEMEDGNYTCMLTQTPLTVRDNQLRGVFLPAKSMGAIAHFGERVQGQTIVRAQLNGYRTEPGEAMGGDCPELGNWDIDRAYRYENLVSRRWVLARQGTVQWQDVWA